LRGPAGVLSLRVDVLDRAHARDCWRRHVAARGVTLPEPDFTLLADRFRLTADQIADAADCAVNDASWAGADVTVDDFCAAARAESGHELTKLARKVTPKYKWDEIILPHDQMAQLREICEQAEYRETVFGSWGFGRKLSLGKGLNILFSGPPGTGKTMAAEVIANELKLDLYKIDLSQIVSKYIGETEKNLDRVFTAAEHSNAILFFDEADALFGKRSEVKDSHDRYANIEIGYLLQKMEEYEGIAILATNVKQNIDEAFVRRIQAIVEFPFPNEIERARVWQVIFPQEAPIHGDVDFPALARCVRLASGNIRSIARASAFYAAADGGVISMEHLLKASRREYQKLGRTWTESEWSSVRAAN
jgi:SpoVK/Ycf46/Vps4 family AAA+-type ATPase